MTSSRSKAWKNSWLALVALLLLVGVADAGGRRRIVVLDFDGPKGEKFHDDVVKLIKKSHTVVAVDKWNGAAEELDAAKVTEKNVKKIAKKLKIDGVVTGKIEKRRDEYIVQLKLRAGTNGELIGNRIDTKADGPRLDGKAQRDVKDELIAAIDELEANHGGGGDDEEDAKPTKKKKGATEEDEGDDSEKHGKFSKKKKMNDDAAEEDEKPVAKKDDKKAKKDKKEKEEVAEEDEKPAKKDDKKAKKDDKKKAADEALATKHDDEDSPIKSAKKDEPKKDEGEGEGEGDDDKPKKKKRVAKKDEGDEDDSSSVKEGAEPGGLSGAEALTPGNRAVDFVIGMSFTARRLSFSADADLGDPPPSYKQSVPVAGGIMDATVYPMAFNHKNTGIITGLGIEIMYDKVIKISSQKKYIDMMMAEQTASLATVEDRFSIGAVLRYPINQSLVIGGKLHYSSQQFNVEQTLPNGSPTDIPNVHYSMIEPKLFLKYGLGGGLILNFDAGFMLVTSTGGIQAASMQGYGPATVTGFELSGGLDYMLTKNIFIRALAKFESISLSFKGDAASLSNTRDTDPMQDVQGAKDTYFGAVGFIGYAF